MLLVLSLLRFVLCLFLVLYVCFGCCSLLPFLSSFFFLSCSISLLSLFGLSMGMGMEYATEDAHTHGSEFLLGLLCWFELYWFRSSGRWLWCVVRTFPNCFWVDPWGETLVLGLCLIVGSSPPIRYPIGAWATSGAYWRLLRWLRIRIRIIAVWLATVDVATKTFRSKNWLPTVLR